MVTARSGEEALRLVLEHDFAVILLDVNMPGMDGLETAAFIRRRKKSAHTPIIFITAFADEMHTAQGYSLGAVDYILSPVVPEVLRTKVEVFVDLFRMTQQVRRQAEERVALAKEQAARAAAEEATRRSTFLAEASTILASSLDCRRHSAACCAWWCPTWRIWRPSPWWARPASRGAANWPGYGRRTKPSKTAPRPPLRRRPTSCGPSWKKCYAPARRRCWTNSPRRVRRRMASAKSPLRSAVLFPLLARDRILGALILAQGDSGRVFGPADRSLAEDLAGRAAIALDNARLYRDIQEADRRKNEFLAMLAHELRNPLAPIRNAVHVLRVMGLPDANVRSARDMIDRQVTHMARLIDDLLDMSRLSRGKILLRKENLDLTAIVRNTVEDYRSILEMAGLCVQLRLPERPLYTLGDPTRLAQIVGNVLHNAGKFTDAGGEVVISLTATKDEPLALISIRDSGIGVGPEMLATMFDTFIQADGGLDRSRGGLGLGLSLVKGLVELHGGAVQALSDGLGKGMEIIIRLPLTAAPAAPPPPPRPASSGGGNSRRILVIEDNLDVAESLQMMLQLSGHEVMVAHTGVDGLQVAQQLRPDVILCDIGLPGGMDGYAVARSLRETAEPSAATLIALSGYGQEEDQRRAKEAGFDRHLTKPVDPVVLTQLVDSLPVLPNR